MESWIGRLLLSWVETYAARGILYPPEKLKHAPMGLPFEDGVIHAEFT